MENNLLDIYSSRTVTVLLIAGGTILACFALASFFVALSALSLIFPPFMKVGLILIALCGGLWIFFCAVLALSVFKKQEIIPFLNTRNIWLKYFVPVARSLSKRIGMNPDKLIRSCVSLNNNFILNMKTIKPISNIMILLPHCLQLHSCGMKLTSDIHNCKKCGRCVVSELIELSDNLKVDIFVASGGTMARRQIAEKKPDLILAVACERDLISGIRDSLPLKVVGVLNRRPEGPCRNTTVDAESIANLLKSVRKAS